MNLDNRFAGKLLCTRVISRIVWTVWENFHTSKIHLTRIFLSRIDQHEWHKYFFGVKLWSLTCKFGWNCEFSRVNSCEIFTAVIEIVQTIRLISINAIILMFLLANELQALWHVSNEMCSSQSQVTSDIILKFGF